MCWYKISQKKKKPKFACRVCGEKQSVRKVYATSFKASDIRNVVMDLNLTKANDDQAEDDAFCATSDSPVRIPSSFQ